MTTETKRTPADRLRNYIEALEGLYPGYSPDELKDIVIDGAFNRRLQERAEVRIADIETVLTPDKLPACAGSRFCWRTRESTPEAIFHPGHRQGLCPRHVPNLEHYCGQCGIVVHYAPAHKSWCSA